MVDGDYFPLLGVRAAVGRVLLPEDDVTPGGHPVVVLSDAFWSRRFGADPGVVGKTLVLNGHRFTVVGVAPPEFRGTALLNRPEVWVPLQMHDQVMIDPFREWFDDRRALIFNAIARLRPGVAIERARAELQTVAGRLEREFPNDNQDRSVAVLPLAQTMLDPNLQGNLERVGMILMAIVGLVLLVACANVANLLLARAVARRREIAVRLAIGAGRARLVRQLLTESLVLSLAAAALGLLIAYWLRDLLWALRPPLLAERAVFPALDARVLGFTFLVALATGILFGLVPALQSTRPEVLPALKNEAPAAATGRRISLRDALMVAQVALSLVALIGAGLFVRGLRKAQDIDPGFETAGLAVFNVNLGAQGYDRPHGEQFYREALERVRRAPGVQSAALSTNLPLTFFTAPMRSVFPEGTDIAPDTRGTLVLTNAVDPRYFETMDMRILSGRGFSAADREGSKRVVIANEAMARMLWPGQDPVGRRFRFFGDDFDHEIVGVTQDIKQITLGETPQACVYLPMEQSYSTYMTFLVRGAGDPAPALAAARREVRALDPNLPLTQAWTLHEVMSQSLWAPRMAATLLACFGLLGLLLAAMGTYSVMTYLVHQRSHDIGIHMALGARRKDVAGIVLRRAAALIVAGIVAGLLGAALATRLVSEAIAGMLYDVSATQPGPFLLTALLLAAVALVASLVPARRAMRVPPMIALRDQ
jgi:predicted permease